MAPGRRLRDRQALRYLERILFVIAIVALSWYAGVQIFSRVDQAWQSRKLDRLQAQRTPAAEPKPTGTAGRAEVTPPPAPPPRRSRPPSKAPIGRVEIPRLGVSAIVREGVDDGTLRRAVGHVPETALPGDTGNVALAAHRDTFFRPLRNIRNGDRIHITTPDGRHEYTVDETRIVDPTDVWVLDPTPQPTLTLVTCYPFDYVGSAPRRFIVRATSIAEANATATRDDGPSVVVTAAAVTPFVLSDSSASAVKRTASKPSVRKAVSKKTAKRAPEKKKSGWRRFFARIVGS